VILDHIVHQGRTDGILIVHPGSHEKGMKHIRIAALVGVILMRLIQDTAGFADKIGIKHKFSILILLYEKQHYTSTRSEMQKHPAG